MGFFRSKAPQGPLPSLSISLTKPESSTFNPDHRVVYRPNDFVSGTVILNTSIPIQPQAIEISLWGESRTWIRWTHRRQNKITSYSHFRDNAPLFTVTVNLLEKPHELVPGEQYTFPFHFRMPDGTGNNRANVYTDAKDVRWTTLPHLLPPSFFFGDGSSPEIPDNAAINYGVTARLLCPGIGTGKENQDPITTSQEIIFQPLNPHAHLLTPGAPLSLVPYTKPFTMHSSTLTSQDPSTLGFRQRLHDRLSSQTPKLEFELGIELPDLLTSGSEFRFRTSFRVLDRCDKVRHIPAIKFKVLKLELRDVTFFRGNRDWGCHSDSMGTPWPGKENSILQPIKGLGTQEDVAFRESKMHLNAIPADGAVVELEEEPVLGHGDDKEKEQDEKRVKQADHVDQWFASRVPGSVSPSFVSFAVSRLYRVKVKVGVECGDKKFAYEVEGHVRELGASV